MTPAEQERMMRLEDVVRDIVREEVKKAMNEMGTPGREPGGDIDKEWLNPKQVAKIYGLSVATLANWRCLKKGPAFVKTGRTVTYRRNDLDDFMSSHRVRTISQRD